MAIPSALLTGVVLSWYTLCSPAFRDGVIALAVDDAVGTHDVLYFSAASNDGLGRAFTSVSDWFMLHLGIGIECPAVPWQIRSSLSTTHVFWIAHMCSISLPYCTPTLRRASCGGDGVIRSINDLHRARQFVRMSRTS